MISKAFALLTVVVVAVVASGSNETSCSCGVFKASTPEKTAEAPLILKNLNFPVECNDAGKEVCAKMCIALAEAAKDKAPKVLCDALGTTSQPFMPLVYSKTCGDSNWGNTGLTSKFQVCCSNKAPIECPATGDGGPPQPQQLK